MLLDEPFSQDVPLSTQVPARDLGRETGEKSVTVPLKRLVGVLELDEQLASLLLGGAEG